MAVKFSNNASTSIDGAISSSVLSVVVTDVSEFPTLGSGDYTYLTIVEGVDLEIIKVTSINTGTKTLTIPTGGRAQDGTTARAFSDGSLIELRMTAVLLNDAASQNDDPSGEAVAMAIALG